MNSNIQRLRRERDELEAERNREAAEREERIFQREVQKAEDEVENNRAGLERGVAYAEIGSFKNLVELDSEPSLSNDERFNGGALGKFLQPVFASKPELRSYWSTSPSGMNQYSNHRTIAWREGFYAGIKQVLSEVNGDGSNT